MTNKLNDIIETGLLNAESQSAIKKAIAEKVEEEKVKNRKEVEKEVRDEFSARIENDKANILEAMNAMIVEALEIQATEHYEAVKALESQKAELANAIKEARSEYKTKLKEHAEKFEQFAITKLGEEMSELSENMSELKNERIALSEAKIEVAKSIREHKVKLDEDNSARIKVLENFVLTQLSDEVSGLVEDKKDLAETKVKLVMEAKSRIDEAKQAFVLRASKIVQETVEDRLTTEITQLKEDIEDARKNMLGRKIFEAFSTEFMTSYLNEGSEIRNLKNELNESKKELSETKIALSESVNSIDTLNKKVRIAETSAIRAKTMNELLSPLARDKRDVMEGLLETVKTNKLRESFDKYLPTVLNENIREAKVGNRMLSESTNTKKIVAKTGDRQTHLAESKQAADEINENEVIRLRRLAGIN